jgi:streptogrisin C
VGLASLIATSLLVITPLLPASTAGATPAELNPTGEPEPPSSDAADPPTSPSPETVRRDAQESIQYLMSQYGIDEIEAIRRLLLQAKASELASLVQRELGDELFQVWLDQDNGGKLTFVSSDPDRVSNILRGSVSETEIRIARSAFTSQQLKAAESEVRSRLGSRAKVYVGINREKQAIAVHYEGDDAQTAESVKRLAGERAGNNVPITTSHGTPKIKPGEQKACPSLFACDPPIRGGVRLHVRRDNGTWGSCTTGFNIRGSNGAAYVLTAGHCASLPGPKRQFMYHNGLPALIEVNASGSFTDPNAPADDRFWANSPPNNDWALLPFQVTGATAWHNYWFTRRVNRNMVQASCVTPSARSCSNGTTSINGFYSWDSLQHGWVVCATGTGNRDVYPTENTGYTPGTRCGTIATKYMNSYTTENTLFGKGIKVNICTRPGDSGGPLFNQVDRKAYGILSGGPEKAGACNLSDSMDYGVYTPISVILTNATVDTGVTMSLITTSTG